MYPVTYEADYLEQRDRLAVFFRLLLAIPWLIMASVDMIGAAIVVLLAWVAMVFIGRQPAGLHNALTLANGYTVRSLGYLFLLTEAYPPLSNQGVAPTIPPAPVQEPLPTHTTMQTEEAR